MNADDCEIVKMASEEIISGVGTYLSGTARAVTARNAFCRPTFWPQTAYCTYEGDVKIH